MVVHVAIGPEGAQRGSRGWAPDWKGTASVVDEESGSVVDEYRVGPGWVRRGSGVRNGTGSGGSRTCILNSSIDVTEAGPEGGQRGAIGGSRGLAGKSLKRGNWAPWY